MASGHSTPHVTTRSAIADTFAPFRWRVAAVALCSFAASLLEAALLVLVTRSILAIAADESSFGVVGDRALTIGEAAGAAAVLLVARLLLATSAIRLQTTLFHRMLVRLRERLNHAFMQSSWATQSQQPRGAFQNLIVQFPPTVVSLGYQLVQSLVGALSLLAMLVIAFVIQPLTALVVLAVVLVLASGLLPVRRAVRGRAARAVSEQAAFAAKVSETADLALEINALGVADAATADVDRLIGAEAQSQRKVALFRDLVNPVYTTLAYGAIVVAVLVLHQLGADDLDATGAVMLVMLRSLSYGQQMQHGASALGQLAPVHEKLAAELAQLQSQQRREGGRRIHGVQSLTFDHVSFAYSNGSPVLRDVSIAIARGEIIGVVGPSGAGKTTLVQLILGLLEPTAGRITVDGADLNEIDRTDWTRLVAYVPQETRLVDGTLADNIGFWRAGITDQQIEHALSLAGLTIDTTRFPHGVHTDLGVAGRQFSGGQRQRLSIARALATEPAVVVLDEPTSLLDAESEEVIVETLGRLRGTTTALVVSHRESTLAACSRVIKLG